MRLIVILMGFLLAPSIAFGAYYVLDIENIDEVGANNRIKFAFPGIEYRVKIAASGGMWPFTWSLGTAPDGMTINSHGIITWASPTAVGSPHSVSVTVTDAENNSDTEEFTVSVTDSTDKFIFVAGTDDGTPTGSITDPYGDIGDFWAENQTGKIVYFRGGTHVLSSATASGMRQSSARISMSATTPHIFIGYPGETAIIDEEADPLGGVCDSPYTDCQGWHFEGGGQADIWFSNLTIDEVWCYGIEFTVASNYVMIFDNIFADAQTTVSDSNQAYLSYMLGGTNTGHIIADNTFADVASGQPTGNFVVTKLYGVDGLIYEYNKSYLTGAVSIGQDLAIKDATNNITVRGNEFHSMEVQIQGYEASNNNDISFNWFDGSQLSIYLAVGRIAGPTYFYRNTVTGLPYFRYIDDDDGDIYLVANVIINENVDTGDTTLNDFYLNKCQFRYSANQTDEFVFSDNLLGVAADYLVTASGTLNNTAYVGVYGWEISTHRGGGQFSGAGSIH